MIAIYIATILIQNVAAQRPRPALRRDLPIGMLSETTFEGVKKMNADDLRNFLARLSYLELQQLDKKNGLSEEMQSSIKSAMIDKQFAELLIWANALQASLVFKKPVEQLETPKTKKWSWPFRSQPR